MKNSKKKKGSRLTPEQRPAPIPAPAIIAPKKGKGALTKANRSREKASLKKGEW